MERNIVIAGATFNGVPSIEIPTQGGDSASFVEVSDTTATAADVSSGKYFYTAAGVKTAGTGEGSAVVQPLSVTQNGTYNPPSGVDGYAPVKVNVSGGNIETVAIEQGGFTTEGLNQDNALRVRSRDYTPVEAGQSILAFITPSSDQDVSGTTWQIEISFYSVNDYTTPRLSSSGWYYGGAYRFTVPTGANYIRMLIGKNGAAPIVPSYISNACYMFLNDNNFYGGTHE